MLLHCQACFQARINGLEPPPQGRYMRDGTGANMARNHCGYLCLRHTDDHHPIASAPAPPDSRISRAVMYNAPELRMDTFVHESRLVLTATSLRSAPKLCTDLLTQWRPGAFWQGARLQTRRCQIDPNLQDTCNMFKQGLWVACSTLSAQSRAKLRAAPRRGSDGKRVLLASAIM